MAGLLSDVLPAVYSASNVMKNKLRGLLDDPLGTLQQAVGNANDRARSFNELGARSAAETMASVKAGQGLGNGPARNELLQVLADAYNPVAMTVWHGSPHKFSKFDASKIGTGEGAQAYGHGLYVAESPKVAQQYAKELSAKIDVNGKPLFQSNKIVGSTGNTDLDDYLVANLGNVQAARRQLLGDIKDVRPFNKDAAKEMQRTLAELRKARVSALTDGNVYKVDLPDDQIAKMLDWDKPMSQQAEAVKALRPLANRVPGLEDAFQPFELGSTTGQTVNDYISRSLSPADAAQMFRKAGIPGIRYLDGGSRGAGAGTSNFVVFPGNENILTILERNGQPVNALRGLLD